MARREHGAARRQVRRLYRAGAVGGLTDAQLLERYASRGGEEAEAAFAALVERHGPMVLRVCRAVLRDGHEAGDAFQATFLVLVRKAHSLWVRDSLGPWLHQVAFRVASCARSASARRRRHERGASLGEASTRAHADWDDLGEALHAEIHRLPEPYRAAVVLCDLEGLTQDEAARRLGLPLGTVRSRLARGRDRLRRRLVLRGLAPSAGLAWLALAADRACASVPSSLADATTRLCQEFAEGGRIAARASGPAAGLARAMLRRMLMTRLKLAGAVLLTAGCLASAAVRFVKADLPARPDGPPMEAPPLEIPPPPTVVGNAPSAEPEASIPPEMLRARPWETVVRVKVFNHLSRPRPTIGFGSGTIIRSTDEESIILTCAHTFWVEESAPAPAPSEFPLKVTVDLFDGKLSRERTPRLRKAEANIPAEVVDYDFDSDVGLLRIRPGRRLPASPLVPRGWIPQRGMKMTTLGCSEGRDATAWTTHITNPTSRLSGNAGTYVGIECDQRPLEGRAGGGLFTIDGELAGVCNFGEGPPERRGLYAHPDAIRRLLDRSRIDLGDDEAEASANTPAPPEPQIEAPSVPEAVRPLVPPGNVGDQERRLRDLEAKVERILDLLEAQGSKPRR
jgi:RNA polymerase sigma factor (sigma-70 family)